MRKLSNTEAEVKERFAYKKKCVHIKFLEVVPCYCVSVNAAKICKCWVFVSEGVLFTREISFRDEVIPVCGELSLSNLFHISPGFICEIQESEAATVVFCKKRCF